MGYLPPLSASLASACGEQLTSSQIRKMPEVGTQAVKVSTQHDNQMYPILILLILDTVFKNFLHHIQGVNIKRRGVQKRP